MLEAWLGRMKGGDATTMVLRRASALLVVTVVLLTVQADNATYKACHTGDGKAHLYNCGPKFDHNDDKVAQLEAIASPTRFVAYTTCMLLFGMAMHAHYTHIHVQFA